MNTARLFILVAALSGAALAPPRAATAAEPTSTLAPAPPEAEVDVDINQARERFGRGVRLYREQSYDAALAEFQKAYELAPDYHLLYNLAQVQAERHDYVAAVALFRRYLARGAGAVPAERRAAVERELAELSGLTAELVISTNVRGAELLVDGIRVGLSPLGRASRVNAGVHRLVARKGGYLPHEQEVTVAGGETLRLQVALEAEPAPPRREEPAPPPPEARGRAGLWLSLGAVVALGATSVAMAVQASRAQRDFERDLGTFPSNQPQLATDRSRLRLYAGLTDGFGGAAIVAAGLFTYLALSGEPAPGAEARSASLRLAVTPGGVVFSGKY
jgi:hypothetical protein